MVPGRVVAEAAGWRRGWRRRRGAGEEEAGGRKEGGTGWLKQ